MGLSCMEKKCLQARKGEEKDIGFRAMTKTFAFLVLEKWGKAESEKIFKVRLDKTI